MGDSTKILSTGAVVLIGDYGGVATDVGYTRGGVGITKSRETRDVPADQTFYPIDIIVTGEGYEINLRLLETTYANLELAWDEPGSGKLGMSLGQSTAYKVIQVYGNRKDGTKVEWTFHKCVPTGFGTYTYSKDDEGLIEVTFRALWDDSEGCIGTFTPATES